LTTPVSRLLAEYIADTTYESISPELLEQFKKLLMDYYAVAIPGAETDVTKKVLEYLRTMDHGGDCTVIGSDVKMNPLNAAFVNGASAHALDFDDGHREGALHPGSVIFPTVFAVAEAHRQSNRDVILGAAIGYDVMIRISMGMHPYSVYRGFHNTAVAGVMGAAAAASKMLGLNREQALNALGLAGSFAGGLYAYVQNGANTKRIHPGKAARDGILCAELAARGLTGPHEVVEGPSGLLQTHAEQYDPEKIVQDLGRVNRMLGCYLNPYPSCRHAHGPIEAAKIIKAQAGNLSLADIRSIQVKTYAVAMKHTHKTYRNLLEIQMSIPCSVAAAFAFDHVSVDTLEPGVFGSHPMVPGLLEKMSIELDEEHENLYPKKNPVTVTVTMMDGKTYQAYVEDPLGAPDNPMSKAQIEEKLIANCAKIVGDSRCKELIRHIWSFETANRLVV